ncbi:MAG: gamma-glutamyl-gamma-aminobutyrate hydrolase family protein [Bacteroidales bacterium]|nr:gamma-glutamyl-gamma-aminobutyrate hydrolase family protein [Bacteroidales bacterium]
MKKIIAFWALAILALVACNPLEPEEKPVDPPVDTTTKPPVADKIKVGICHSGMSSSTLGFYQKCLGDCGAKVVLYGNYCYTEKEAEHYVSMVDAIISPGSTSGDADGSDGKPKRSVSDNNIISAALAAGKPILGICYGHQRLNAVLGGTTVQVSKLAPESEVLHKYSEGGTNIGVQSEIHNINIEKGSLLHELIGQDSIMVNSSHEYAVSKIASRMKVSARANDGIVEGIESNDGSPLLGVQFHPEYLYGKMGLFKFLSIFDWLVTQAKAVRDAKGGGSPGDED